MEPLVSAPPENGFGLNNLPWGVFNQPNLPQNHIGVALGEHVVDITVLQKEGIFTGPVMSKMGSCFSKGSLNEFMSLGPVAWAETRATLQRVLSTHDGTIRDNRQLHESALLPKGSVMMQLPADIGDYTDFYASKQHAFNCGALFRGPGQEIQPNWSHLPVGYHGRSSSIVVSGTSVRRPWGQVMPAGREQSVMAPCAALDFELEMACFIGQGNNLGSAVRVDDAESHVFGMVLLNDWSARDIQKWECVPLGPFNGKNFSSQISPWVVTMAALEPFTCEAPVQDPEVLPYMREKRRRTFDVQVVVDLMPSGLEIPFRLTTTNFNTMYYTWPQMIAHHTLGGCNLRPGDLLGSGTISSGGPGHRGCLLEATSGGKETLHLTPFARPGERASAADGISRVYLEDGDTVILSGCCGAEGGDRVSFGECRGQVLPCHATIW